MNIVIIIPMQNNAALRIPLYVQVRERLRDEFAALPPGSLIPTEARLEERFSVSRITIRRAIDDLVLEGLLVRQQGRGTFREAPKLVHELNAITSWTEQLKDLGYAPHTAAQELTEIPAPKKIAQLLQLALDEKVIQLRRTRLANNEPITLMVNYIPSKNMPGFLETGLQTESLYECLRVRYGLSPAVATDTVETRPASEAESERLKIEPWSPVLVVTRVAQMDDGRPFEVAVAVSRGDRYEYRVKLQSRNQIAASS
jgi:DNA-binding GntR family transcriptional regulator